MDIDESERRNLYSITQKLDFSTLEKILNIFDYISYKKSRKFAKCLKALEKPRRHETKEILWSGRSDQEKIQEAFKIIENYSKEYKRQKNELSLLNPARYYYLVADKNLDKYKEVLSRGIACGSYALFQQEMKNIHKSPSNIVWKFCFHRKLFHQIDKIDHDGSKAEIISVEELVHNSSKAQKVYTTVEKRMLEKAIDCLGEKDIKNQHKIQIQEEKLKNKDLELEQERKSRKKAEEELQKLREELERKAEREKHSQKSVGSTIEGVSLEPTTLQAVPFDQ